MIVGRKNGITNLEGEGSLGIRVLKRCEMEINTLRKPAEREAGPRGVCSSFLRSQGSRARFPSLDILSESKLGWCIFPSLLGALYLHIADTVRFGTGIC